MRFLSRRQAGRPDATLAQLAPAAQAPAGAAQAPPQASHGEVLDAIESDVLKAIGSVGESIAATRTDVVDMQAGLAAIRARMSDLAEAAEAASAASSGFTERTEGLSTVSTRITDALHQASGHLDQAGSRGAEARALMRGRLLDRAALKAMRTVDPLSPGYGLGLLRDNAESSRRHVSSHAQRAALN